MKQRIKVKGKYYLSFSSNNYLGLSGNRDIKDAIKKAIDKYGVGSGGTRLVSGTLDIQVEFEKKFSNYFGFEDSITFSSGYLANVGVIRMLIDPFPYFQLSEEKPGIIISDELNHASIIDGVRLSKSTKEIYRHSNMKDLEDILKRYQHHRKLIITDGVFSMDGDTAPLPEILKIAKRYDAIIMIDDAHATGVFGQHGKGMIEHYGLEGKIDIIMGSLSKAIGSIGGFIAGSKHLIEFLKNKARSFIYTTALPPAVCAASLAGLALVQEDTSLIDKLWENIEYLKSRLSEFTNNVTIQSPIIPVIVGSAEDAVNLSNKLYQNGILIPAIRPPTVPPGTSRLRISLMTTHSKDDINRLIDVLKNVGFLTHKNISHTKNSYAQTDVG